MLMIVKIQGLVRGWLVRRRLKRLRALLQKSQETGEFDETIKDSDFLLNPIVRQVYQRDGPYQIPAFSTAKVLRKDQVLVKLAPFRLQSGIIYHG